MKYNSLGRWPASCTVLCQFQRSAIVEKHLVLRVVALDVVHQHESHHRSFCPEKAGAGKNALTRRARRPS